MFEKFSILKKIFEKISIIPLILLLFFPFD